MILWHSLNWKNGGFTRHQTNEIWWAHCIHFDDIGCPQKLLANKNFAMTQRHKQMTINHANQWSKKTYRICGCPILIAIYVKNDKEGVLRAPWRRHAISSRCSKRIQSLLTNRSTLCVTNRQIFFLGLSIIFFDPLSKMLISPMLTIPKTRHPTCILKNGIQLRRIWNLMFIF